MDSCFKLDRGNGEWGGFIGRFRNQDKSGDVHTDDIPEAYYPNWQMTYGAFDTTNTTFHTHYEPLLGDRHIQDPTDIFVLKEFLDNSVRKGKYYPRGYVHCGDKIYCVVIEDRVKALSFFNANIRRLSTLDSTFAADISNSALGANRRERSIKSIKKIFGTSQQNGFALYESVPPANLTFIKLN